MFPPHDLTAEALLVGVALLDSRLVVDRGVKPEHFYSEAHRRIFEAVVVAHSKHAPAEIGDVADWLRARRRLSQVGGLVAVRELFESADLRIDHTERYTQRVLETARAREVIRRCDRAAARLRLGHHVDDVVAELEQRGGVRVAA